MKIKNKTIKKEISGKVIGISEEKKASSLNILLDNSNIKIEVNSREYQLGERLDIEFTMIVNKLKKI